MKTLAFTKKKVSKVSAVCGQEIEIVLNMKATSAKDVMSNNADVLILEYPTTKTLVKEKNFKHAQFVLVSLQPKSLFTAFVYSLRYLVRRRLNCVGFTKVTWDDSSHSYFIVLMVNSRKQHFSERSYFPMHWSNSDFLKWLDQNDINYVVMRWYEEIITKQDVNDIDILIADSDVMKVRRKLDKELGTKAVDLHALSGGETGGIDKMAYFPPVIGHHLLENKVKGETNVGYTLQPIDEFRSLAYHALFRKGYKSGLKKNPETKEAASGKIFFRLSQLREQLSLKVELDMTSLLAWLEKQGWIPPNDMIAKIALNNLFVQEKMSPDNDKMAGLKGHYFAIMLREITETWQMTDRLIEDVKKAGFLILYSHKLSDTEKSELTQHVRGGNWSSGPWPVSGGGPSTVLIVVDKNPIPLNRRQRKNHKAHNNARILFKQSWRDEINSIVGREQSANFVHTSDNNIETLDYINHFPEDAKNIIAEYEKKNY